MIRYVPEPVVGNHFDLTKPLDFLSEGYGDARNWKHLNPNRPSDYPNGRLDYGLWLELEECRLEIMERSRKGA